MLPSLLATQTVTVIEPQMIDDHGASVADWSVEPASSTVVEGCSVQPQSGAEGDDHRRAEQSLILVFMPHSAAVGSLSRLSVDDFPFDLQVVGEPLRFVFGLPLDHIEVRAQRWEG